MLVLCFVLAFPLACGVIQITGGGETLDREAIVAFYEATGGANWEDNWGWLSE